MGPHTSIRDPRHEHAVAPLTDVLHSTSIPVPASLPASVRHCRNKRCGASSRSNGDMRPAVPSVTLPGSGHDRASSNASRELQTHCMRTMRDMSIVPPQETREHRRFRLDVYLAAVCQLQDIQTVNDSDQCAVNTFCTDVPTSDPTSASVLIVGVTAAPTTTATASVPSDSARAARGSSTATLSATSATTSTRDQTDVSDSGPCPRPPPDDRSPLPQDGLTKTRMYVMVRFPPLSWNNYDSDYARIPDAVASTLVDPYDATEVSLLASSVSSLSPESSAAKPDRSMTPPPPRKPKRKFRGHGWSKKGSKQSRAQQKLQVSPSPHIVPSVPPLHVPSSPPRTYASCERCRQRGPEPVPPEVSPSLSLVVLIMVLVPTLLSTQIQCLSVRPPIMCPPLRCSDIPRDLQCPVTICLLTT